MRKARFVALSPTAFRSRSLENAVNLAVSVPKQGYIMLIVVQLPASCYTGTSTGTPYVSGGSLPDLIVVSPNYAAVRLSCTYCL